MWITGAVCLDVVIRFYFILGRLELHISYRLDHFKETQRSNKISKLIQNTNTTAAATATNNNENKNTIKQTSK